MYRNLLWRSMEEFNMPTKLINMCKAFDKRQEVQLELEEYCHPFLKIKQV
jgi:hypothetical protein